MRQSQVRSLALCLLVFMLAAVTAGQAGQTSGRIEGTARDQTGGAVPGVTVTLSSNSGTKTMVTGDSGEFAFPFLVPGTYTIKAELQGFKTYEQSGIEVRLGLATSIHLVLSPGEISETVTVTGETPLVDTTTTSVGANISDRLYSSIPVRRNIAALFTLAPGVTAGDGGEVLGEANPSIGGASGLENNYVVDGVNITNTGYGSLGTFSHVYGSLGSGVNYDFVKEVQVKAGGFEPEYGQSLGGVVNIITKAGSNEFHGGVYFYGQPSGFWSGRKQPNLYRDVKSTELLSAQEFDVSFDLSGYLWKDKFFFYTGFNPQWQTSFRHAPAGIGQDVLGMKLYERQERIYAWSAKATWVAHPNHTLEFSTFADPANVGTGPNRGMTSEGDLSYSNLHYGSWNWIGRYSGVITNNFFATVSLARAYNRFSENIFHDEAWAYQDFVKYFYDVYLPLNPGADPGNYGYIDSGGVGFFENNDGKNWQFNTKLTGNFRAAGDHTLDGGYVYEDIRYTAIRQWTGGLVTVPAWGGFPGGVTHGAAGRVIWFENDDGTLFDRNHDGAIDTSDAVYMQVWGNFNDPHIETSTRYHSFYLQDAWKISNRLTLKAGVRYDYQQLEGSGEDHLTYTFDGNWAPRFGMIYDVRGDGKTKIYGSWGRFFEKIPNDIAVRAMSTETSVSRAYWGNPDLTDFLNPTLGVVDLGITGMAPTVIYPGTKSQYQDELVLGVDHEIGPTLSIGARYIFRDIRRVLEDVSGGTIEQSLEGLPVDYVITNPSYTEDIFINSTGVLGSDGVPDGFADPERSYNAFEVTLEKRFADGLQFLANYRLAKLWGNYEGLFRNDRAQLDPNISSLFDFRWSPALGYQFTPGYLNTDVRHIFNLNGSYTFPSRLTLGLGIRLASGIPLTPLGTNPAYETDGEIPLQPRGAAGRGDWINDIDLHADYPFTFGETYRLRLSADMFNVFNRQKIQAYDQNYEISSQPNPDYLTATSLQRPFGARFSVRFEF